MWSICTQVSVHVNTCNIVIVFCLTYRGFGELRGGTGTEKPSTNG